MSFTFSALLFAFVLFLGMLLLLEVGRRIALRQKMKAGDGASDGFGALGGSVFALLGLLIAFTFSGAASRFDVRRHLVVEETNAIGTAYLRLDLLPAQAQARLKEDFRQYLDARLEAYRRLPDIAAAREGLARATTLQGEIWRQAVAALQEANNTPATTLLLSALNEMIDITTTRTMAAEMHPPMIIFVMLGGMTLAVFPAGRLRHGKYQIGQLDTQACLRGQPCGRRLCHHRPRVSAPGVDSSRGVRSGARRAATKHEVSRASSLLAHEFVTKLSTRFHKGGNLFPMVFRDANRGRARRSKLRKPRR